MKIGIIQTAPLTADFSNNVRKIVQGKYMYSIPAMLKESVVTTLRFSEERMYDYIEKYFLDNY